MPDRVDTLGNGTRLIHISELPSTNSEAMRRAVDGTSMPFWLWADRQTAGRGRSGRQWAGLEGNLFASYAMRLALPAPKAFQLSLVAGIAVADAIRRASGAGATQLVRLKWPNDILIGRKKAGGILVESTQFGVTLKVVIGIGLNIVAHPTGAGIDATHLRAHTPFPDAKDFLEMLAISLEAWLGVWREGEGFDAIRSAWLGSCGPMGEVCTVNTSEGICSGQFSGLDEDGALLLKDEIGRVRRFTFGDVTLSP